MLLGYCIGSVDLGVNGGLSARLLRTKSCRRRNCWLAFLERQESELIQVPHSICLLIKCCREATVSGQPCLGSAVSKLSVVWHRLASLCWWQSCYVYWLCNKRSLKLGTYQGFWQCFSSFRYSVNCGRLGVAAVVSPKPVWMSTVAKGALGRSSQGILPCISVLSDTWDCDWIYSLHICLEASDR